MNLKKIKEFLKDRKLNIILVVLFALLIVYGSSLPSVIPDFMKGTFLEKIARYSIKSGIAHAAEFGILSLLLFRAFYVDNFKHAAIYAVLIAIAFGVLDEVHQLFVPGRVFDYMDMTSNAVGAIGVQFFGRFNLIFLK